MSGQPTLICIPDISGFTNFMSDADFELSSKVIPALLNNIIYSNEIDLKVSEIEGDAVLFYRTGALPTLGQLVKQCKHFYTEFYKQLELLREQYIDINGASKIPKILGLKIILHFGEEIGLVNIGKRIKLMGEDVISAHRLLKNNIPFNEYMLFSNQLINQYKNNLENDDFDWAELREGHIDADYIGEIHFNYINLSPLSE
ncbi:DUF2652 domain-containing protein [Aurantibacter sp.]|uniref:DUF2652 domain-containing protein n=1 Tax=Aurantibacter sp. TaxID=2807103 RepID=UPI0032633B9C